MSLPQQPRTTETSRRGGRWPLIALLAGVGVVVLVLAIAAAVVVGRTIGSAGDEAAPAPRYPLEDVLRGEVAWTAPAAADDVRIGWLFGTTLAYAEKDSGRVTGVSTRTGEELWTYRLPAPARSKPLAPRICAATRAVLDGTVAIGFQRDLPSGNQLVECSGLVLLDLRTGKPRWQTARPNRIGPTLTFAAGRLVVADNDLIGYDLDSPKPRWSRSWDRDDDCRLTDAEGDAKALVAIALCGEVEHQQVWTFDPKTGSDLTRVELEPRPDKPTMAVADVVSVDPVVVHHTKINLRTMETPDTLTTLSDDRRTVRHSVELLSGLERDEHSPPVLVAGSRAVVVTDEMLQCFDLATGRSAWIRLQLAPDGQNDRNQMVRVNLAGTDGTFIYGVVSDSANTGVFRVEIRTGTLVMISPPVPMPYETVRTPSLFLTDDALYGVTSGYDRGAAFALR